MKKKTAIRVFIGALFCGSVVIYVISLLMGKGDSFLAAAMLVYIGVFLGIFAHPYLSWREKASSASALAGYKSLAADAGPIPIAVSARHAHLTKETFAALFGPDAQPTHIKELAQPGQFACEETIALTGPRGRIDRVRIMSPFRSKNQIEVSRTDEFKLGIDAPIRSSGDVAGSQPVTVEGPEGKIELDEGLICASRHIHMSPDDAQRFGVADHDEVAVAISGGPRDLMFGDVRVRVNPAYKLEMHIDTDEANAAEFDKGVGGEFVYASIENVTAHLQSRYTGHDTGNKT